MDNVHSVAELRDDDLIGEGGHVRVIPCVDGNVVASIEGGEELLGVVKSADADHEVSGRDVVLLQEADEFRGLFLTKAKDAY